MYRAGADDRQQATVFVVENMANAIAGFSDQCGRLNGGLQLVVQQGGAN
jgi:hypothetical protein